MSGFRQMPTRSGILPRQRARAPILSPSSMRKLTPSWKNTEKSSIPRDASISIRDSRRFSTKSSRTRSCGSSDSLPRIRGDSAASTGIRGQIAAVSVRLRWNGGSSRQSAPTSRSRQCRALKGPLPVGKRAFLHGYTQSALRVSVPIVAHRDQGTEDNAPYLQRSFPASIEGSDRVWGRG